MRARTQARLVWLGIGISLVLVWGSAIVIGASMFTP